MTQTTTDIAAVADALRAGDRFLVTSHENPDGDALGSLLAMHLALVELGKDSVMVLAGAAPLPAEYGFLELAATGFCARFPPTRRERVLVAVDCAQETRLTDDRAARRADRRQHRPPPRQHALRHRQPRRRRGFLDRRGARGRLRRARRRADAGDREALYAGLVTDTGRFQYSNTTPKALRLAAELVEAGADLQRVFQGVYESMQFAKLKLLARALDRAALYEDGRVVVSYLVRSDFGEVGAVEPYSEGIIDVLRAVEGAEFARSSASRRATATRRGRSRSARRIASTSRRSRGCPVAAVTGRRPGSRAISRSTEITAFIVAAFAGPACSFEPERRHEPWRFPRASSRPG